MVCVGCGVWGVWGVERKNKIHTDGAVEQRADIVVKREELCVVGQQVPLRAYVCVYIYVYVYVDVYVYVYTCRCSKAQNPPLINIITRHYKKQLPSKMPFFESGYVPLQP